MSQILDFGQNSVVQDYHVFQDLMTRMDWKCGLSKLFTFGATLDRPQSLFDLYDDNDDNDDDDDDDKDNDGDEFSGTHCGEKRGEWIQSLAGRHQILFEAYYDYDDDFWW